MERNLSQSCGREGKREGKIPCGRRICREFGPFRHDMRRKGLGFWGLAAKFPKRGSREFFFLPRAGNAQGIFRTEQGFSARSPRIATWAAQNRNIVSHLPPDRPP